MKELEIAVDVAERAGQLLMKFYGKVNARFKKDKSFVTQADLKSEQMIKKILGEKFPNYSFLGEETGLRERNSKYVWVVDPLDGTTNFSITHPFFAVSIALVSSGTPVVGVVHYPFLNETFSAEKQNGAFLNGRSISISRTAKVENSILTFCHSSDASSRQRISSVFGVIKRLNDRFRQMGSASLELCYVACGRTDAFMMVGVKSWDVAAGALIVEEAGGKVTDFEGRQFTVNSRDVLASNGNVHPKLLAMLTAITV